MEFTIFTLPIMHLVHPPPPTILHKLGFALNLSWDNCNTQEVYPVFAGKGAGGEVYKMYYGKCEKGAFSRNHEENNEINS